MTRQRIVRLLRPPDTGWAELAADLEAVSSSWPEIDALTDLQLVRLDDAHGQVVVSGREDDVLDRVTADRLEPWLAAHGLDSTALHERGEVVSSLRSRRADAGSRFDGLDDAARRAHFVDAVVSADAVWGLYGETWARSTAGGDAEALPFWPDRRQAARCVAGDWGSYAPRSIDLDAFIEQWLVGMHEDGIVAVIHPTPSHPGVVIDPLALAAEVLEARESAARQ